MDTVTGTLSAPVLSKPVKPVNRKWKHLRENAPFLLMILPAVVVVFLFCYLPIYGVLIAFQDFMPGDPILSKDTIWVGFENFSRFFNDPQFWPLMKNTFLICIFGFVIGFPLPIIISLTLNALKSKKVGKTLQTIFTAPHFISLVVLVGMLSLFFGSGGLLASIARHFGGEYESLFLKDSAFRPLYILSSNWQDFGWSAVIYIAALSNVDPQQHEAAILDGATRFQRVIHVDLPAIMPTIAIMLILRMGGLISVGFEKAYLMQSPLNLSTSELISTYVYKRGLSDFRRFSYGTAVSLFNTAINVTLMLITNYTSKKVTEDEISVI